MAIVVVVWVAAVACLSLRWLPRIASSRMPSARRIVRSWWFVALVWLIVLESGARGFWWIRGQVSPTRPGDLALAFYPEMRHGLHARDDDDAFDVLLLGGSVLNFGADEIHDQLDAALDAPIRVHNVAWPSHGSLDSVYKYEWLGERASYDLVIFYHAINEVRANNVPPELFEADYSHYSWYATLNALDLHAESSIVVLPFTLHYLGQLVGERLGFREVVPQHQPKPEWVQFGKEIKTADSFRGNLTRVIEFARERGEPLLVMSFAWYVPDGYTQERFLEKALPYTPTENTHPIEIWGEPQAVAAGIEAHNAIIRELASSSSPGLLFLDQEAMVPKEGALFGDICHLSAEGRRRFAENLIPLATSVQQGRLLKPSKDERGGAGGTEYDQNPDKP